MTKFFLLSGSLAAMLAVMIGAFGAHAFKGYLATNQLQDTFETAVKYQIFHALGLLAVGILSFHLKTSLVNWAGILLFIGMCIFSISLYLLCITKIKIFGAITPLGGLAMIAGWILLSVAIFKEKI